MKTTDSVIAIDGPAGSGKSSIAKIFAERIAAVYIDTGAMFRAIGYVLENSSINVEDDNELADFLKSLKFEYGISESILIRINNDDLTQTIREHEVSALASKYSQYTMIRNYLADFQRSLVSHQLCVMEGRDIGTVIFPNAFLKIFLTASVEVRAGRRFNQLIEAGKQVDMSQLIEDIKKRDIADMNREIAPLKKADDAIELDTSNMNLEEVLDKLVSLYKENKVRL